MIKGLITLYAQRSVCTPKTKKIDLEIVKQSGY